MAPVVQADPLTAGRGPASLNAATFKIWLDNNAVGYIAIGKRSLHPNAEYKLVSAGELGYLSKIWANTDWTLFRVADPTPIVPASARITDADQSNMTIEVSHPGTVPIRCAGRSSSPPTGHNTHPESHCAVTATAGQSSPHR
jgi:hypothetical protein